MQDGSQQNNREFRIWGPPGTGKTTFLTRQVALAGNKFGPSKILVTSFTKAAAIELSKRNQSLCEEQIGTLHSICYRALGTPTIAETKIRFWNEAHPEYRLMLRTDTADDVDAPLLDEDRHVHGGGDELFGLLQILRARMVPPAQWPQNAQRFAKAWADWKRIERLWDFTDMLEVASRELKVAPGDPQVIVVDEAQDLSRLQLLVLQQWANHADCSLWAGDDDQGILSFAGADPEALLETAGEECFREVLSQSYRVPRRVHALAEAWIQRVTRREPKVYRPRPDDGEVRLLARGNYRCPDAIVNDAEQYLAQGKTVMFLATCAYMLAPLRRILVERGLPFSNPYRLKRRDWNPLAHGIKTVRPVDRLQAFVKLQAGNGSPWHSHGLRLWLPWIRPDGVLTEEAIRWSKGQAHYLDPYPEELFEPDALKLLIDAMQAGVPASLEWWLHHLKVKHSETGEYLVKVAERHGISALTDAPQIILGTVHSVKGGEADAVYVFPDLSASGVRQWAGSPKERDAVIRLAYVAITRARESLILCGPAASRYIPLEESLVKLGRGAS
jgi:DNA helicase-2/ATP-dependent DNA helicase PcrA